MESEGRRGGDDCGEGRRCGYSVREGVGVDEVCLMIIWRVGEGLSE
jgi:hypothetical protein